MNSVSFKQNWEDQKSPGFPDITERLRWSEKYGSEIVPEGGKSNLGPASLLPSLSLHFKDHRTRFNLLQATPH